MIDLRLSLITPWNIGFKLPLDFCKTGKITKHKNFEIQTFCSPSSYLFDLDVTTMWWGTDHAGPHFNLTILGFYLGVQVYDGRHWNFSENRWFRDDEDPFEGGAEFEPEN